jgi:tRNA pseudouridine55 synthase
MEGLFLLDKAIGPSSAQALASLKKKLNLEKIGHAGTLDPAASGLLICLSGRCTKLARFAEGGIKVYSGIILLGTVTTTDDLAGEVLSQSESIPSFDQIEKIVNENFVGEIVQTPPQYSALKVAGKRAYALARSGVEVKLEPRKILVKEFKVKALSANEIFYQVTCGSGTYIRSLARDLGQILGCGACIKTLRREASFPFNVTQAKVIEKIENIDLLHWSNLFPNLPMLEAPFEDVEGLRQGAQPALARLAAKYANELKGLTRAIYSCPKTKQALGLIENDASNWVFAFQGV